MERKDESKNIHTIIEGYKKEMGLDKTPIVHPPIRVKKDGKHLYRVAGYFYPMKPETLERLNIPNQRIICEVDREEWLREMREAKNKQGETPTSEDDWWD